MNRILWGILLLLLGGYPYAGYTAEDPQTQLVEWYGLVEQYAYTDPVPALQYLDSVYGLAAEQEWWHYCFDAQLRRVNIASRHLLLEDNLRFLDQLDSLGSSQEEFIKTHYLAHPDLEASLRRGNYAFKTGQYAQAYKAFQGIRKRLEAVSSPDPREAILLAAALRYLGAIHQNWGAYTLALEAYAQALRVAEQIALTDPVEARIPHTHKLLGDVYRLAGAPEKATEAYTIAIEGEQAAMELAKRKGPYLNRLRAAENSLVFLLLGQKKTHEAEIILQQSQVQAPAGSAYAAARLLRWGHLYRAKGQLDQALTAADEAIEILEGIYSSGHPDIAQARHFKGTLLLARHDWVGALALTEAALTDLPADPVALPKQRLSLVDLKQSILVQMAIQGGDPNMWAAARAATENATNLIDQLRHRYRFSADKTRLLAISQGILHRGLNLYALIYQQSGALEPLEAGFRLAEKSKGLVLLESWQKTRLGAFAGLPDSMLQRDAHLAYRRQNLAQRLAEAPDDSMAHSIEKELGRIRIEQEQLAATLALEYPAYYKLGFTETYPDLKEVQRSLLEPDQALLSYVMAGDTLHIFGLSTRGITWELVPGARHIDSLVYAFRDLVQRGGTDPLAVRKATAEKGYLLWRLLLQPAEASLTLPKRLVISPDGVLNLLPFGALTRQPAGEWPDELEKAPYLIQDYACSYTYSAALWAEMRNRPKRRKSRGWLGFAPSFSASQSLNPLYYNQSEVRDILSNMEGKGVLGAEATRARFLEMAPHFQYLHLATHGQALGPAGAGFLAFAADEAEPETGLLELGDIYGLELDAEMVVLSACETGVGTWQAGEGVMSLARGFAYAKAQSVIPSLWAIDGAASSALMEAFYAALRDGHPKDLALQMAQQQMLAEGSSSDPYFWAAFLPIGDMAPLRGQGLPFWVWILFLGGIAGLIWWRKR